MTGTTERHRPIGVTILVVLLWVQAVLQIIGGLVLIFARNDAEVIAQTDLSSSSMLWLGIAVIVIGLITAWVANAVGRGSGFARGVVAFFTILSLIGGIVELFSIGGHLIAQGLTSIVVALVILYILFGERGSQEFFGGGASRA